SLARSVGDGVAVAERASACAGTRDGRAYKHGCLILHGRTRRDGHDGTKILQIEGWLPRRTNARRGTAGRSSPEGCKEATMSHKLIASDRVEGSAVYDRSGRHIGTIERVMIDKISGKIAYAVLTFGGFLGFGQKHFPTPWDALKY